MGDDTLINRANGQVIDQDWYNLYNRVLQGDFIGRDSSGAPTAGQNLGTAIVPWGIARITDLVLNGSSVDPGLITAVPNRVISGKIRTTSNFPAYLLADGTAATVTIVATPTDLVLDINSEIINLSSNIVKTGLTIAPTTNNTCLVDDISLTGQDSTKNLGEDGTTITVDNMGSELTGKVGEFVALINNVTSEILYCYVESTTVLSHAHRGFFFDSSGDPIVREVLNNNDTLRILSLGYIFIDADGVTVDVSYTNPSIGGDEPGSPQTSDYWYDYTPNTWKRYSGSSFDAVDRTFIGYTIIDAACIAARPQYFSKFYNFDNTTVARLLDVDNIIADVEEFVTSIDGQDKTFNFSFFTWSASSDFESGVFRTKDRTYYLYITEDGTPIISDKKPYNVEGFLKGYYHPYESWRAIATVYNNSSGTSGEFEDVQTYGEIISATSQREGLIRIATTAENQAGVLDTVAATPLGVREGIIDQFSIVGAEPVYAARAWVLFDGSNGNILNGANVSGVNRVSAGLYTITFAIAIHTIHYSIVGMGTGDGNATDFANICLSSFGTGGGPRVKTTTQVQIQTLNRSGAVTDSGYTSVAFFA